MCDDPLHTNRRKGKTQGWMFIQEETTLKNFSIGYQEVIEACFDQEASHYFSCHEEDDIMCCSISFLYSNNKLKQQNWFILLSVSLHESWCKQRVSADPDSF